jgi:ribosomal protein L40E
MTLHETTCLHPDCQANNPTGANFCGRCGRSLIKRQPTSKPRRGNPWSKVLWFTLSMSSFVAGMALMRMGICFGVIFIGLPILSIFVRPPQTRSSH